MTRAELSTGEALVGLLEAYGVDTIFGIPGVHNVEMYRALPRSGITPHPGPPRAGRRLHGRRLCARDRQARRLLHHHRPGAHQHPDPARPGVVGFEPDLRDLLGARHRRRRAGTRPPARDARTSSGAARASPAAASPPIRPRMSATALPQAFAGFAAAAAAPCLSRTAARSPEIAGRRWLDARRLPRAPAARPRGHCRGRGACCRRPAPR